MLDERLFPREVTGHVPRVTIIGSEQVMVEQHCGLTVYQPDMILFRSFSGYIRVRGNGLRFQSYTAAEAVVVGTVDSVSMEYTAGGGST